MPAPFNHTLDLGITPDGLADEHEIALAHAEARAIPAALAAHLPVTQKPDGEGDIAAREVHVISNVSI